MPDEMEEIIDDFIMETQEVLEGLDEKFVELESRGEDPELINEIFRSVHTVKGAAGFLGFQQVVDVSHRAETLLKKIRDGEMSFTSDITDVVLKAVDTLKVLIGHVKARDGVQEDIALLLRVLESAAEPAVESPPQTDNKPETKSPPRIGEILVEEESISREDLNDALEEQDRELKIGEILIDQKGVDPEVVQNALNQQKKNVEEKKDEPEREVSHNIRVDVKRLDSVMNLVGEMVLGRNRLINIGSSLEKHYPED